MHVDKTALLVERLVLRTKSQTISWRPEQLEHPPCRNGNVGLLASVRSHRLRLSLDEGLQVQHHGQWEAVSEDEKVLEPLWHATGLKVPLDVELAALLENVLQGR